MQKSLYEIGKSFDTDKTISGGYIQNYEQHFGHLRNVPIKMLELGVFHGGSLLMWNEFFLKGAVVGLDLQPNPLQSMPDRVRFYQGSQDDIPLLSRIAEENAPEGFDIIIDDAAHIGTIARTSFSWLFNNCLKSGGSYVIEDWGTGYWCDWPDGAIYRKEKKVQPFWMQEKLGSTMLGWLNPGNRTKKKGFDSNFSVHNFGMVGFVKELVDQLAWKDITKAGKKNYQFKKEYSDIRQITFHEGQVFIVKK